MNTLTSAATAVLTHLREHQTLHVDDVVILKLHIAVLEEELASSRALLAARQPLPPPSTPIPLESSPPIVPASIRLKPPEGLPFKIHSATEPYECSACHTTKSATDFPRQATVSHEHRRNGTVCKACTAKRAKERQSKPPQKSAAELLALPPTREFSITPTFRCQACLGTAFAESLHNPGMCVQCAEKMRVQGVALNGIVAA